MVDLFLEARSSPRDLPGPRQHRRPACTATRRGVSSTGATAVACRCTSSAATMCCARGCGHVDGAAAEELARIVERIRKRWPRTRVRGDGRPRRDVVRRQRRRRPVRPVPQRPPDGARRQAVAQVAQPLRFDRRGLASVLRLPLPDPGIMEPRAAGSRESGAAFSRRPLRRDLPEPQAGGGASSLRETLLRSRGERNQGAATCSLTRRRPRPCSPAPLLCDFRQQ